MSESISYVPFPDKLSPANEIDCEETLFNCILMPGSSPKKGFFVVCFAYLGTWFSVNISKASDVLAWLSLA